MSNNYLKYKVYEDCAKRVFKMLYANANGHQILYRDLIKAFFEEGAGSIGDFPAYERGFWTYISWYCKQIAVHGPYSKKIEKISSVTTSKKIIISTSKRGGWVGPFATFSDAVAFAFLLQRAIFQSTGNMFSVSSGWGLKHRKDELPLL